MRRAQAQTILVVEDECLDRLVRLALPQERGLRGQDGRDRQAALAQVAAQKPALIVLDLMLPDIDGIEVCKRIRRARTCRS